MLLFPLMISGWVLFLAVYNGFQLTRELMVVIGSAVTGLVFFKVVCPARRALQVFSVSLPYFSF